MKKLFWSIPRKLKTLLFLEHYIVNILLKANPWLPHSTFQHPLMLERYIINILHTSHLFNCKHERLNNNSLIIALCLSYLDFLLLLKQWMNINTIKYVDHFNINHERLNKNILILALGLSYLQFLLIFKKRMNINYNKKCGLFQFQAWEAE